MITLTPRDYQPSLLWALAVDYEARSREPEDRAPGQTDLALYIYRTDRPGAYYLYGPKMYWSDEVPADHWSNCDQSELADNAAHLGEVVMINRRSRRTTMIGHTFAEAVQRLTADWRDQQQPT